MCLLKCVVAAQLSRKTGGTPHSEIFWQFLHHCLDAFPECFVSLEPQGAHDAMPITGASHSTVHVQGNKICRSGKGKQILENFSKGLKFYLLLPLDGSRLQKSCVLSSHIFSLKKLSRSHLLIGSVFIIFHQPCDVGDDRWLV